MIPLASNGQCSEKSPQNVYTFIVVNDDLNIFGFNKAKKLTIRYETLGPNGTFISILGKVTSKCYETLGP
jgi:hypothetical protein